MRIALAQINPLVGDLSGNAQRILEASRQAIDKQADLVVTPELAIWGYPPRDLLLNRARVNEQQQVMDQLSRELAELNAELGVLVGLVEGTADGQHPRLFNAAALIRQGSGRW